MNEIIIEPRLLDPAPYQSLQTRINSINDSSHIFQSYVMSTQLEYSRFATRTREDCEYSEGTLIKLAGPHHSVDHMVKLVRLFKSISLNIQKMTAFNMVSLQSIQKEHTLHTSFRINIGNIILNMNQYKKYSDSFQQSQNSYKEKCVQLALLLDKFEEMRKPTKFYNPTLSAQYLKKLESKYRSAIDKEQSLGTYIGDIMNNKRQIQKQVKELKDELVVNVKSHISKIYSMIRAVIDSTAWDHQEFPDCLKVNLQEHYQMEMERLNGIFQSDMSNASVQTIKNLMKRQSSLAEVNEPTLFLEKCQYFIAVKSQSLKTNIEIKKQFELFLNRMIVNIQNLRVSMENMMKNIFGQGQKATFHQKIIQYFGSRLAEAFQIVENIVMAPVTILSKIEGVIQQRLVRIRQIIDAETQYHTGFQKDTSAHFHSQNQPNIIFEALKTAMRNINQKEVLLTQILLQQMNVIGDTIEKECYRRFLRIKMERDQGTWLAFNQINVDSEVIRIINEENCYQILYTPFFTSQNYDVGMSSEVDHKRYIKLKEIYERKQMGIINDLHKPFLTANCCVKAPPLINFTESTVYKCYLEDARPIAGKMSTLSDAIHWKSKSKHVFVKKTKLLVPRQEIKGFEIRDAQGLINCIVVHTKMGQLLFSKFEHRDQMFVHLTRMYPIDETTSSKVDNFQSQKRIRSSDLQSGINFNKPSSFRSILKNSQIINTRFLSQPKQLSSTSIQVTPTTTHFAPLIVTNPQLQQSLLGTIIEKWNVSHNFFPADIIIQDIQRLEDGYINSSYATRLTAIPVFIKQRKKLNLQKIMITIQFLWKVSFPKTPSIKEFTLEQTIRIEPSDVVLDIHVNTLRWANSFMQDQFQKQVKKMNQSLWEFLQNVTNRTCQVQEFFDMYEPEKNNQSLIAFKRGSHLRGDSLERSGLHLSASTILVTPVNLKKDILVENRSQIVANESTDVTARSTKPNKQLNILEKMEKTRNSEGSPQEVRAILLGFLLLFLALFVL